MSIIRVAVTCFGLLISVSTHAQTSIKVGVLTDLSGPYADFAGEGTIVGARLAVEEFRAQNATVSVEVVSADHQNKPDVGATIARRWFDREGVDAIVDVANSGVALAVSEIAKEKDKVFLASGPATPDLTGKACSPNTVHWTYDTYALSHGTGSALVKSGGDTWFFLTADYAFGHAIERDTSAIIVSQGGKVVGGVKHPLNTSDFSSFLLQAQAAKTKVIGLANAGADTVNAIKQASEFGITDSGTKVAALLFFITDVHSLGLRTARGTVLTEAYYWDLNEQTRAFAKRFAEKMPGRVPTQVHAGAYSATLHYLRSIAVSGSKSGAAVVSNMKRTPTVDSAFGRGSVRQDGRHLHDMYLFEVKNPNESKARWDYYKLLATIPAQDAFRPLSESSCPFLKK